MLEQTGRLEEGELINGRWEVRQLLGFGELGEVYDVLDRQSGQLLALKLYVPQVMFASGAWNNYLDHDRRVRALSNPAIVNIDQTGIHAATGSPFSISARVSAPPLDQLVSTVGMLIPEQLLGILQSVAPVLDHLHGAGIVHRNLKPSNVFCSAGKATLTRISDCSMQLLRDAAPPFPGWGGTPGWIAPEGVELRRPSTPQMDVYALGLISFFALTGRPVYLTLDPFDANTFRAELQTPIRSASERAKDLGVHLDPRLDPWFQSALAPEPGRRFESAGRLARSLEVILYPPKSAPQSLHPPSIRAPRLGGDRSVAEAAVQPLVFSEGRQDSLPAPTQAVGVSDPRTATTSVGMATWILAGAILLLGALMVLVAWAIT